MHQYANQGDVEAWSDISVILFKSGIGGSTWLALQVNGWIARVVIQMWSEGVATCFECQNSFNHHESITCATCKNFKHNA